MTGLIRSRLRMHEGDSSTNPLFLLARLQRHKVFDHVPYFEMLALTGKIPRLKSS